MSHFRSKILSLTGWWPFSPEDQLDLVIELDVLRMKKVRMLNYCAKLLR